MISRASVPRGRFLMLTHQMWPLRWPSAFFPFTFSLFLLQHLITRLLKKDWINFRLCVESVELLDLGLFRGPELSFVDAHDSMLLLQNSTPLNNRRFIVGNYKLGIQLWFLSLSLSPSFSPSHLSQSQGGARSCSFTFSNNIKIPWIAPRFLIAAVRQQVFTSVNQFNPLRREVHRWHYWRHICMTDLETPHEPRAPERVFFKAFP